MAVKYPIIVAVVSAVVAVPLSLLFSSLAIFFIITPVVFFGISSYFKFNKASDDEVNSIKRYEGLFFIIYSTAFLFFISIIVPAITG